MTPEQIAQQRAAGWPDFHPEDFCHRCGRRNLTSWCVNSRLWNAAIRQPDEANIREGYPTSEIICPQCFDEADVDVAGTYRTWRLVPEPEWAVVERYVRALRHKRKTDQRCYAPKAKDRPSISEQEEAHAEHRKTLAELEALVPEEEA